MEICGFPAQFNNTSSFKPVQPFNKNGSVGQFFAADLKSKGWTVSRSCTTTRVDNKKSLAYANHSQLPTDREGVEVVKNYTRLLVSIPPVGDPKMKRKMGDRKKSTNKKTKTEWPSVKPKSNLRLNRLKDDDLFTIDNYLTNAESKAFVSVAESIGFEHQGSRGPTYGEAFRDNHRISLNDPVLAQALWECGLDKIFSEFKIRGRVPVGLNPNLRFYRYTTGQRFGRHIDESVDLEKGARTHYTLLIYLSGNPGSTKSKSKNDCAAQDSQDHLVGGETVFYGPRNSLVAEVPPTEGMALLHIHGDKCMLHEARNVSKGAKYVLRSDVVFA